MAINSTLSATFVQTPDGALAGNATNPLRIGDDEGRRASELILIAANVQMAAEQNVSERYSGNRSGFEVR